MGQHLVGACFRRAGAGERRTVIAVVCSPMAEDDEVQPPVIVRMIG
ncbi:hypothetical protein ACWC1D_00910 [Streptomyces sp. NPDC001478]